jgi:hypothetical protein
VTGGTHVALPSRSRISIPVSEDQTGMDDEIESHFGAETNIIGGGRF